jgi:protein O-mannosyl-transferase
MVSMPSRGLAFAVAAITVLVFAPVLGGTFLNWDDDRSLLTNQGFRGVDPTHLRWMFTTTLLGHYAPLTWLSFGVTYAVAGMAPAAYHAGSVLLHALNAVLVYLLAARLIALARPTVTDGARLAGATVAALAFAVHPLRAESVGWITDRGTCCARRSISRRSSHTSGSRGTTTAGAADGGSPRWWPSRPRCCRKKSR